MCTRKDSWTGSSGLQGPPGFFLPLTLSASQVSRWSRLPNSSSRPFGRTLGRDVLDAADVVGSTMCRSRRHSPVATKCTTGSATSAVACSSLARPRAAHRTATSSGRVRDQSEAMVDRSLSRKASNPSRVLEGEPAPSTIAAPSLNQIFQTADRRPSARRF